MQQFAQVVILIQHNAAFSRRKFSDFSVTFFLRNLLVRSQPSTHALAPSSTTLARLDTGKSLPFCEGPIQSLGHASVPRAFLRRRRGFVHAMQQQVSEYCFQASDRQINAIAATRQSQRTLRTAQSQDFAAKCSARCTILHRKFLHAWSDNSSQHQIRRQALPFTAQQKRVRRRSTSRECAAVSSAHRLPSLRNHHTA